MVYFAKNLSFINQYLLIVAALPFIATIFMCYCFDMFPKKSAIFNFIGGILDVIVEKDLEKLLKNNGFEKMPVRVYQAFRIICATIFIAISFVGSNNFVSSLMWGIILSAAIYKGLYFYLVIKDRERIKRMNQLLPYTLKTIAYMMYLYPPRNAIQRASQSCPKEYKYDLEQLFQDIYKEPTSYQPYLNFINRYDGRIIELDKHLTTIYRIAQSGKGEANKILVALHKELSDEVTIARQEANNAVNRGLRMTGFLPLFGVMATMVMCVFFFLSNGLGI